MSYYNNAAKGAAMIAKEDYSSQSLSGPTAQPFTTAILETLTYINNEIVETDFALGAIQERIFGDSQMCGDCADGKLPHSMEAQILSYMRDILTRARDVRSKAQVVNSRL